MFKKYSINSYLRMPLNDLVEQFTPEFKGHLRVIFQTSNLEDVVMEYGSDNDVIFHYKGEK